jgi:hypothetical protein
MFDDDDDVSGCDIEKINGSLRTHKESLNDGAPTLSLSHFILHDGSTENGYHINGD